MKRNPPGILLANFAGKKNMSSSSAHARLSSPTLGPHPSDYRAHHPAKSGDKFHNPWPSWGNMAQPLQFAKARFVGEITSTPPKDVMNQVKWQKTDFSVLSTSSTKHQSKVAWLGHASSFIEFPSTKGRGLRVLCDPVFSKRCSPSQWFGPSRYTPATTSVPDLPDIDLVLLSHNHYDHLDHDTIVALLKKYPDLSFIVPLKVKSWMLSLGIDQSRVVEMDWWECLTFTKSISAAELKLTITYLPAQHGTGRALADQGMSLWGSYAMESQGSKVFFAGDTGRRSISAELESRLSSPSRDVVARAQKELDSLPTCPAHRQIGELIGPFDLSIIPIGAYFPRRLMSPVHIDPGEAIEIYQELRTKRAVGVHWGTFSLSGEQVLEPMQILKQKCQELGVSGFECWEMGKLMVI